MFLCCTPDWKSPKDLHLEIDNAPKPLCGIPPPSDNLDVVDNPNVKKTFDLENKSLFETMKWEKNRWDSFDKKWPLLFINIGELVASGFFYLQSDDKVQCAFCKLILCSWKAGEKPLKEHIKSSPKCPFLIKGGNVLSTSVLKTHEFFPHSNEGASSNKPKNLRMIDLKMRLSTFKNWPHATIKVQDLAECGLYYTGVQDVVTCFYCGGSLSNWEPSDEPIVEHAKFYPKCNYLRIIQCRPVYKRLKVVGSSLIVQAGGKLQADNVLKSDIVRKAKEIFPSSLVEKVVVQHLQKGETFSSLHHLCEKLLQEEDLDTRLNLKEPKREISYVAQKSASAFEPRFEGARSANDILLCKICMDSEREVLFQPCGHLISCEKCASLITKCPLCRKPIESRMRTFLS